MREFVNILMVFFVVSAFPMYMFAIHEGLVLDINIIADILVRNDMVFDFFMILSFLFLLTLCFVFGSYMNDDDDIRDVQRHIKMLAKEVLENEEYFETTEKGRKFLMKKRLIDSKKGNTP